MDPFHHYVDRFGIKRVTLVKNFRRADICSITYICKGYNYGFLGRLRKKRDLDVSSVPAHDNECNCTETDQCNQCTVPG